MSALRDDPILLAAAMREDAIATLEAMRPRREKFSSDEAYLVAWRWFRDEVMPVEARIRRARAELRLAASG